MSNVTENVLMANYISTTLNGAILAGDLAMTLTSVTGLPTITTANGKHTYLELQQVATPANREIVKVTDITGSVLTIVRAQDGTSALGFADGDRVRMTITRILEEDFRNELKDVIDYVDYALPGIADQTDAAVTNSIAEIMANYGATTYHTIILRPGTYTIPDNLTCDQYTSFHILGGAEFDITVNSKTLAINGGVMAGHYPIKTAPSGTARKMEIFNQPALVEWYGATPNMAAGKAVLENAALGAIHLVVSSGINVEDDLTLDTTLEILEIRNGAILTATSTKTLTFSGQFIHAIEGDQVFGSTGMAGTINNDSISAHWFGAQGDGATDDETSIEAAITFSRAGGTITFISGLTYLTGQINVTKEIILDGGHFKSTAANAGDSLIDLNGSGPSDSTIRNCYIEVPGATVGGDVAGIKIESSTGVFISNCTFSGAKAAASNSACVYLVSAQRVNIENCRFTGADENTVTFENSSNCTLNNCILTSAGAVGSSVEVAGTGAACMISANVIKSHLGNGVTVTASDVAIINNMITGNVLDGIVADGSNIAITGNNITGGGAKTDSGVACGSSASGIVISGNSITDFSNAGGEAVDIDAAATDIAIQGNVLTGNFATITDAGGTNVKIGANVGVDDVYMAQYDTANTVDGVVLADNVWTIIPINTEMVGADFAAAPAASQITVQPGTYECRYQVMVSNGGAQTGTFQAKIRDTTADLDISVADGYSSDSYSLVANRTAGDASQTPIGKTFRFSLTAASDLEMRVYANLGVAGGTGKAAFAASAIIELPGASAPKEVYAWLEIRRAQ